MSKLTSDAFLVSKHIILQMTRTERKYLKSNFINSVKEVLSSSVFLCVLFVCLFVCQQDYTNPVGGFIRFREEPTFRCGSRSGVRSTFKIFTYFPETHSWSWKKTVSNIQGTDMSKWEQCGAASGDLGQLRASQGYFYSWYVVQAQNILFTVLIIEPSCLYTW